MSSLSHTITPTASSIATSYVVVYITGTNSESIYIHRMKLSSLSSSSLCSPLGPPVIISSAKHVGVVPGILLMIPHFPHVFTKPTTAFKLLRSIIILAFEVLKKTLDLEATFPSVSHGLTSATRIIFSLSGPKNKNDTAGTRRAIIFSRLPYPVQTKVAPACVSYVISNYAVFISC